MNYFTPTQERIALVECASYNQRLLALRARRLAQQRMDYFHRMAVNEREEAEEALNGTKPPINLGPAPQLTAESDDEEYELKEIHAPVPYQKGYWLAAKNAAKNRQRQQQQGNLANRNAAHSRSQQRPNTNTQHHQRRSIAASSASSSHSSASSSSSSYGSRGSHGMQQGDVKPIKRSPYKYQYNANANASATNAQSGYRKTGPSQQPLYPQQQKQPQYKPASQHHPSYTKKRKDGPPALV